MEFYIFFTVFLLVWLLLGRVGWELTVKNTNNQEWLDKINKDNSFRKESKFFHIIFGVLSFINGVLHSL